MSVSATQGGHNKIQITRRSLLYAHLDSLACVLSLALARHVSRFRFVVCPDLTAYYQIIAINHWQ